MASALAGSRRLVFFSKGLRSLASSLRDYSQASSKSESKRVYLEEDEEYPTETVWPDESLGIFAPNDTRMSLPGNVGLASDLQKKKSPLGSKKWINQEFGGKCDVLTGVLPNERHESIVSQAVDMQEMALTQELENELFSRMNTKPKNVETLQCIAQECPRLVKKEFSDLFPDRNFVPEGLLTVITISQKTVNDMSTWSEDVGQEREELNDYFMVVAKDVCDALSKEGFWADFIDPFTGKPHLGPYTNSVFSETDERYRHFGFSIEDLGCCKVISHQIWGTRTFVGSLFSDVPLDNPTLKKLLLKYTMLDNSNKDQSK